MSHNSILVGLALASVPGIAAAQEFQEVFSSGGCSLTVSGSEVVFSGCNITINNGDGQTATANGLGNLIIGDNLSTREDDRSGSHNLVIGDEHSYSARNGLIAGTNHKVRRNNGVAVGGRGNKVTAAHASVFGGQFLQADENKGTVVGDNSAAIDGLTAEVARLDESFASLYASNRAQDSDIDDLLAFTADNAWRLDGTDAVLPGFITPAYLTTNGYITKAALDGYARLTDLDGYALLSDLPNLSGYAERSWVESDFVRRNGFVEFAEQLQVAFMPWVEDNSVSDEELTAMKFVNYETLGDYATKEEAAAGGIAGLAEYLFVDPETDSVVFSGANVFIQDGSEDTPCGTLGFEPCTGLGNLIVGYDEAGTAPADGQLHGLDRGGSHNIVTGRYHDYESFGGLIAGYGNRVSLSEGAALGGRLNVVDAPQATVLGGEGHTASVARGVFPLVSDLAAVVEVTATDVYVEGANLHVRNGTGSTLSGENGLGNLIIGYDEHGSLNSFELDQNGQPDSVAGSHNIVLGDYHSYPGAGGFVGGFNNDLAADGGFIATGSNQRVEGVWTFVGSGRFNVATGSAAAVLGGDGNTAEGTRAVVAGGLNGTASGDFSMVGGGELNSAAGRASVVSGGLANSASGELSVVAAGWSNQATGQYSSSLGGSGGWDQGVQGVTMVGDTGSINTGNPPAAFGFVGPFEWAARLRDLEDAVFP